MDSYEDSCVSRCRVERDTPQEVADLINLLPPEFQSTVTVRTPCEKYPKAPIGWAVEDAKGNLLYFEPYFPAVITRMDGTGGFLVDGEIVEAWNGLRFTKDGLEKVDE